MSPNVRPSDIQLRARLEEELDIESYVFSVSLCVLVSLAVTNTNNRLHWPLCAALLIASAAAGRMVQEDSVEHSFHW